MTIPIERHLPIAGTFNVRDLGGYPHPGGVTGWRRMLRADSLHRLDADGIALLKGAGVVTVIDLRHDHELESYPNPFRAEPGVDYRHVSLFEQLAPSEMAGADMLHDLYVQALTTRGEAIATVLTAIAEAPEGAVLFHCTAGKDRTGLIAALLLAAVGVENALIVEDYALTKTHLAPALPGFIADAQARGVEVEKFRPLLACEPETMAATLSHLTERHGTVEAYLTEIGLQAGVISRLKVRLTEDA